MSVKAKSPSAPAVPLFEPADYDAFLAKLGTKDRLNVERHITACEVESDPAHAKAYKRLLCALAGLAPHAAKTAGQQAIQFFIPDGKYRMQVYALQDARDGVITIYCDDVLDAAVKAGLLNGPHEVAEVKNSYRVGTGVDSIKVDQLDGRSSNPTPFYKDMLGWNRKALRITLPSAATTAQVQVTEALCALGSKKWIPA